MTRKSPREIERMLEQIDADVGPPEGPTEIIITERVIATPAEAGDVEAGEVVEETRVYYDESEGWQTEPLEEDGGEPA